ncbi:MAG: leucine-rich repeat domain-containing protein [Undibacterium umbellatum]|uniref:leucine-rich repeat domain-containing protein n=1 Tax=Undibacterium umbellatum TaxID=2762300 RepID=UPI003BB71144
MFDATNASSYKAAERLIAEAAATNASHLALNSLRIAQLPPSLAQLKQLESLELKQCPWLTDISILQSLPQLRNLVVQSSRLIDIKPLEALISLQSLDLSGCELISDLAPLKVLTSLQSLDLPGYGLITDLAPLKALTSLQSFNMFGCKHITDLVPLQTLTNLKSIDFSWSGSITDLTPLKALIGLHSVNLSGCREITDFTPLQTLTNLESLDLSECREFTNLASLQALISLQSLNLAGCGKIADLTPLKALTSLHKLTLSRCGEITDLTPLQTLTNLKSLSLNGGQIADLTALHSFTSLQSLYLSDSEHVIDLTPLKVFTSLQSLALPSSEDIIDLTPLKALTSLRSLDLSGCEEVVDLTPLKSLVNLQLLNLGGCRRISNLFPLQTLTALRSLYLYGCNKITDLTPLRKLVNLEALDLSNCEQFTDITLLQTLVNLQSLDLSNCEHITDLTPLQTLTNLQSLYLSGCKQTTDMASVPAWKNLTMLHLEGTNVSVNAELLENFSQINRLSISRLQRSEDLFVLPHLTDLYRFSDNPPQFDGVPVELLDEHENLLDRLVPWQQDCISNGTVSVNEIKLFILGNGRVGKTQLARRLQGMDFDNNVPSTHGIQLGRFKLLSADREQPELNACLWDFGGQDIYLGTHGLFLDEQAIYVLAWNPDQENDEEFVENGVPMRNRPIAYWLAYIQAHAGDDVPVIVVQTQCDKVSDEVNPPVPRDHRFTQLRQCGSSSQVGHGLEQLWSQLHRAGSLLRERHGAIKIPKNWAALADLAQTKHDEGEKILSFSEFSQHCSASHSIAPTGLLADYLHRRGKVFWREGAFDNNLILDQQWALQGIYALLTRDQLLPMLRQQHGRFTATQLAATVWQNYKSSEQALFLELMQQCGTCFAVDNAHYIAPELLPPLQECKNAVDRIWRGAEAAATVKLSYEFLHEGIVRAMLCQIGEKAGDAAVYWRKGVCYYDLGAGGAVRVSADWGMGQTVTQRGEISIEVEGAQASTVAQHLVDSINSLRLREKPEVKWLKGEYREKPDVESRQTSAEPFEKITPDPNLGGRASVTDKENNFGMKSAVPQHILSLATEWNSNHGGLSTFNRELCLALAKQGLTVCCAVASATKEEIGQAAGQGVTLILANATGDDTHAGLHRKLPLPVGFIPDAIIGHGRITGHAARSQQVDHFTSAARIHFLHMAAGDIEWYKGKDDAAQTSEERDAQERNLMEGAALVAAVGPRLERHAKDLLNGLEKEKRAKAINFLPGFRNAEFHTAEHVKNKCLMLCRADDAQLKGVDIAAKALASIDRAQLKYAPELVIRGAKSNTGTKLQQELSAEFIGLDVKVQEYTADSDVIDSDIRSTSLLLMPSRTEGFGLVALEALRLGTPILVSSETGFAEMLESMLAPDELNHYVVDAPINDHETAIKNWQEQITFQLRDVDAAVERTKKLVELLERELTWEKSCENLFQALSN